MFSFAKKLVDRLEGGSSTEDNGVDSYFKNALQLNNKGHGLRVLNVVPHSLAHTSGFESWFDYIIKINGHELPMANPSLSAYPYSVHEGGYIVYQGNITPEHASAINTDLLHQEISTLAKNEKPLVLDVWSAKGGIIRQITVPLNKPENQTAHPAQEDALDLSNNVFSQIGLTVQSSHLSSANHVWRILKSHPGSPGFVSQLVPYSDYIIGCDSAFPEDVEGKGLLAAGGESLLSKVVASYYYHHFEIRQVDEIPITLYVYNHDYDILRPVTVNLSKSWGNGQNRGVLGCDVGYGLLHRLPEVVGKFQNNSIVDDVIFESDSQGYGGQAAQSYSPPPPPPPPSGTAITPMSGAQGPYVPHAPTAGAPPRSSAAKKKKHVVGTNALGGLSDYMNEELAKSKELDSQTNRGASEGTPPPPPPTKSG